MTTVPAHPPKPVSTTSAKTHVAVVAMQCVRWPAIVPPAAAHKAILEIHSGAVQCSAIRVNLTLVVKVPSVSWMMAIQYVIVPEEQLAILLKSAVSTRLLSLHADF